MDSSPDIAPAEAQITSAREFVHTVCCYNPRTATDILIKKRCRAFTAAKIRALTSEYMSTHCPTADLKTQCAILMLTIASNLPSYARVGGGILIARLAKYMSADIVNTQLDYIADSQITTLLWTESFLRAGLLYHSGVSSKEIAAMIEPSAEAFAVVASQTCADIEWIE